MGKRIFNNLAECKRLAQERGGKCLSLDYQDLRTKMKWECGKGHVWESSFDCIKYVGSWCPVCRGSKSSLKLEDAQRIAKERGGECLSTTFHSTKDLMTWKCSEGHVWQTVFHIIKYTNSWCPQCRPLSIEEASEFAKARRGKCLSTTYKNAHEPLKWECEKGHQWETSFNHVKYAGTWCRECAFDEKKLGLEVMRDLAKSYKGKCLSTEYVNNGTKLLWECERGHRWEAKPSNIRNAGRWCQECPREDRLKELQELAQTRNGLLLDKRYVSTNIRMKWKCLECDNEWMATAGNIKAGKWCPHCRLGKLSFADLKNLAREKGGECLSEEYKGWKFKYDWRCREGHEWSAYVSEARNNWCGVCKKVLRQANPRAA